MAARRGGTRDPAEWDESSGRDTKILRALKDVDDSRPGVEHQLAILFSDIVGSTRYFEEHGDAEGLRMIKRHHELLEPVVQAHEGRVVKRIGDGLMAVFGSARDALEAAREMQLAVCASSEPLAAKERVRIRIGLHYGRVLVDSGGDIFGDVVNVAARIQAKAEPDQILVGESLQERLEGEHALRSVGIFQLKGRSSRLEIFELPWKPPEARPKSFGRWALLAGIVVAGCLAGIVFAELRPSREFEQVVPPVNAPIPGVASPPVAPAPPVTPPPTPRKEATPEGRLTLVTFPPAELWLGHRHLGRTPLFNVALPLGVHPLQVIGDDRQPRVLSVTVKRGQPVTLKLKLADIPLARH